MTLTIVSGAALGVEQGAIEAAVNLALHWQGWAPLDEIGRLPAIYRTGLQSTSATDPGMLRRINIQEADGTLVFSTSMVLAGVSAFVDRVTEQMGRAFLHVTLNPAALQAPLPDEVRAHVQQWIRRWEIARVYVTGPSADDVPGIQGAVRDALIAILEPFAVDEVRQTTRMLDLVKQAAAVGGQPTHIVINPANVDAARAAGLDVQYIGGDVLLDAAGDLVPVDCRGEPLDLGPDDARCGEWLPDGPTCGKAGAAMDGRIGPRCPEHHRGPPEGLDALQRAQLDASIREAERDIRTSDEPPTPGDQTA